MRYLPGVLLALLLSILLNACISDSFSSDPSLRLAFSSDTVAFDTVFTDLGTPTARLKVYNRNKENLTISKIRFRDPQGPFSFNVDGVSGREFSDVEIRGGDSIFVFIECYLPENTQREPFLREDMLEFTTNGNHQQVVVEAYGQNVTRLHGLHVNSDLTLNADLPYVIFDSLYVAPGATLTLNPGTRLLFHDKAALSIQGSLHAVGTPDSLIHLRGDRLDNVLPDVAYDIMSGQWRGVRIGPQSLGNRMEYVDMRSTKQGLILDSVTPGSGTRLTLVNSWLHNSEESVLKSKFSDIEAYGCVFSEAAEAVVELRGGQHAFSQCTIANNYLFVFPTTPMLELYHLFPGEREATDPQPLMKANFDNSILYGLSSDLNYGDLKDTDVFFRYTSFKSAGSNDDYFLNCLWDTDPMFRTVREDYYFNYTLLGDSPCIGAGDPALVAQPTETDIRGHRRLSPPALGAYAKPDLIPE